MVRRARFDLMRIRLCHWPTVLSLNITIVCAFCSSQTLVSVAHSYVHTKTLQAPTS